MVSVVRSTIIVVRFVLAAVVFVRGGVFTIVVVIVPHSFIGGVRSFPSTTECIFNSFASDTIASDGVET